MKGKHFKKKEIHFFRKALILILAIIFIISLVVIIFWLKSNIQLSKIEKEVIEQVVTENNEESEEKKGSISVDFQKLSEINSDVVGWIYIKNTDINYPILQTDDNEYYLKRDIYKNYSSCGSIFLDCNSNIEFSDDNTIIYGHNLKNQKMFADLAKIYNGELGESIEIEIYLKSQVKIYEVITSYEEEPNLGIIERNFKENGKEEYINKNLEKSKVKFKYTASSSNNIITLVTCDSTGKNRIVVTAVEKI